MLLIKLFFMGLLLTGGLKTYADVSLLNDNPELSGVVGIILVALLLFIFPKLIGFIFKFILFTIIVLGVCQLCGFQFSDIIQKLSSTHVSPLVHSISQATLQNKTLNGHITFVKNGHSFVLNNESVQLFGIDTPDPKQLCYTAQGTSYSCGEQSLVELNAFLSGKDVNCTVHSQSQSGTKTATCFVDGDDVAALMVRDGWAIADKEQSDKYVEEEKSAYLRKTGLWNGKFQEPKKWREKHKSVAKQEKKKETSPDISVWRGIKKLFGLK